MMLEVNSNVTNMYHALMGMRNPLGSWDKSDSVFYRNECTVGERDLKLGEKLVRAGDEHGKFTRQIFVCADITAPLYWWKEFDTYKIGTTANSTSTMHTLTKTPITKDMFSIDDKNINLKINHNGEKKNISTNKIFDETVYHCELLRKAYLETKDKDIWRALIQLLPESFNQLRTVTMNYAILRNIYRQRRNHKLTEWHDFCDWILTLPYAKEFIVCGLDEP